MTRDMLRNAWHRHRRPLLWWLPAVLIAVAVAIAAPWAATYQPLQPADNISASFPGLRTATGMRSVYQYIPLPNAPELYVPPQPEPFGLSATVVNTGSFPVTIVGVSQPAGSPFSAAGPVRYLTLAEQNSNARPPRHLLRDYTLGPGQGITIGIPLRIGYCADRRSYVGADVYLLAERFLGFTSTVPLPFEDWGRPVLTNAPGGQPGPPGTFCS